MSFYKVFYTEVFGNEKYGHNLDALNDMFRSMGQVDRTNGEWSFNKKNNVHTILLWHHFEKELLIDSRMAVLFNIIMSGKVVDYGDRKKQLNIQTIVLGIKLDLDLVTLKLDSLSRDLTKLISE